MKDIIEIVESLEDFNLLPKEVSENIQNEAKDLLGRFLSMLLCTLGVSLLGNILASKEINRAGEQAIERSNSKETKLKRQSRGILTAGYGNKKVEKHHKSIKS